MRWIRVLLRWCRGNRLRRDIDDELAFHLEMRKREFVKQGLPPEHAHRAAHLHFGNRTSVKEDTRRVWGTRWLGELRQDALFALRSFRKNPGFTSTALVTLSLGIGVGTAILSIVNAVLLSPPPYKDADRLVMVWDVNESRGIDVEFQRMTADSMGPAEFLDWQEKSGIFSRMVGFSSFIQPITDVIPPEGLFELIGTQPVLGRGFLPEEEQEGAEKVLVLGHDFWERHFGSDAGAIGKKIHLAGEPYTVIGVMPPEFTFYNRQADALAPLPWTSRLLEISRDYRNRKVMARLQPGMDLEEAQARSDVFAANLSKEYPESSEGWGVKLVPVTEDSAGPLFPAMQALLGAISIVLLITCTNVASLLLAKATGRTKELAIRSAIGAGRRRLIRQMFTESLCISIAGGLAGLGLAYFLVEYFNKMIPDRHTWAKYVVQSKFIAVDPWVVGFALAAALGTGLLFGLLPALSASRIALNESLNDTGQGSAGGLRRRRIGDVLVSCEVALAAIMVIGAMLLVRSSIALYGQGPGIRSDNHLSLHVRLPWRDIRDETRRQGLSEQEAESRLFATIRYRQDGILEAVRSIPGVRNVTATSRVPLNGFYMVDYYSLENHPELLPDELPRAAGERVAENYFPQLGIPLIRVRLFDRRDSETSPRAVLVNQEFERRHLAGENPIGQRLKWGPIDSDEDWHTIVGVVGDVRIGGMREAAPPMVYYSASQAPLVNLYLLVQTQPDPITLLPPVRQAAASAVPAAMVSRPRTLKDMVTDSAYPLNYSTWIISGLAVLALVLAVVGLYGLLSQTVRDRTREIGLRMALGADQRRILAGVVGQGVRTVTFGLVIGLAAAGILTRFLQTLLFGVKPSDPATFAGVALVLLGTAIAAAYIPARQAAAVDPMIALRHE